MSVIKITVNLLMLIAIIISFRRFDGEPILHVIFGSVFTLLFVIHFCLNKKTFVAIGRNIKKLKRPIKLKFIIDLLLLVVWSAAIITGILAFCSHHEIIEMTLNLIRLHGVFARIGGGLVVIHVVQHSSQIVSCFKKNKMKGFNK